MGLILLPLFVQKLSLSEYGILGILEVTVQILVSTFGLGIWYALERWYWDKDYLNKQKSMYFTVLAFSFVIALFFIMLSTLVFNSCIVFKSFSLTVSESTLSAPASSICFNTKLSAS